MAYIEFAKGRKRKPTSASVRQKISRALTGKKRKKGGVSTKKKAAVSLGVAGGLGAAALVLSKRKSQNPSTPGALNARSNPLLQGSTTGGATSNARSNGTTPGANRARGEENSNYPGGVGRREGARDPITVERKSTPYKGVGRREQVKSTGKKRGLNIGKIRNRFGK